MSGQGSVHPPHKAILAVTFALLLATAGCGGSGAMRASRANDRLRAENLDLKDEAERLSLRNKELEAQLQAATEEPRPLAEEYRIHAPHVAALSIDSYSHVVDNSGDGRPETLVLYVSPRDGLGRFVQMVGRLTAQATVMPIDADPITLGRITLGPAEIRQAYRSSFMGTHYTVEVPLMVPSDLEATELIAHVEFVDGYDGRKFADHRSIALEP